jgi:hypothetical protein
MTQSKFLGLNISDAVKGVIMAFVAALLTAVYAAISDGDWPSKAELIDSLRVGLTASLAYILKNLFTNSDGVIAQKEQP